MEQKHTPADEIAVLAALSTMQEDFAMGFEGIAEMTSLDRRIVRQACRALSRKGLAEFRRGLWTEDGEPAGSGYAATSAARAALSRARQP